MKLALFAALLLSACAELPSMKYCDHVQYERRGNEIVMEAHCIAPVGQSL